MYLYGRSGLCKRTRVFPNPTKTRKLLRRRKRKETRNIKRKGGKKRERGKTKKKSWGIVVGVNHNLSLKNIEILKKIFENKRKFFLQR